MLPFEEFSNKNDLPYVCVVYFPFFLTILLNAPRSYCPRYRLFSGARMATNGCGPRERAAKLPGLTQLIRYSTCVNLFFYNVVKVVFRRQNHITFIFIKAMSYDLFYLVTTVPKRKPKAWSP